MQIRVRSRLHQVTQTYVAGVFVAETHIIATCAVVAPFAPAIHMGVTESPTVNPSLVFNA
ncbi:MAG TPA: hypothetical protein VFD27_05490 [Chthoniobacteraceae bacterium]|nr:hypothetical protein [Chthoniobacteraceae bacterium]